VCVREPAGRIVDLKRGDAEVKQNPLNLAAAHLGEHRRQLVVARFDECDPVGKLGQALAREGQRVRIAIESDQLRLGTGREHGVGMSPQAERAINNVRRAASVGIARGAPKNAAAVRCRISRRCLQSRSEQGNDFRQHDG
jgi:hypothetical protein